MRIQLTISRNRAPKKLYLTLTCARNAARSRPITVVPILRKKELKNAFFHRGRTNTSRTSFKLDGSNFSICRPGHTT